MIVTACLAFFAAVISIILGGVVWTKDEPSIPRTALTTGFLLIAIDGVLAGFSCCVTAAGVVSLLQTVRFIPLSLIPGVWLVFALTYSRGIPRKHIRQWRYVLAMCLMLPFVVVLLTFRQLVYAVQIDNDPGSLFLVFGPYARALHGAFIAIAVLVLINLERTLRAATGTMRWRIKYMVVGTGLLFCMRIYISTQAVLYSGLAPSLRGFEFAGLIICLLLMLRSLLRARLLHVDVYPSQAVLYHSVTMLVAGTYLLVVGLLAKIVTLFGITDGFPVRSFFLMLALMGLTILFLSDRVRQGVRHLVGRYFSRPQYDYRKIWKSFATQSARAIEAEPLCRSLARMLSETFEILGVTIWLVNDAGERLMPGGSTSLVGSQARDILSTVTEHVVLIDAIRELSAIVDIDANESDANRQLRTLVPVEFDKKGGHRICMPLRAGQDLLGLVALSDRVRGLPFTTEELDLIVTIGEEISANLLKIRLSSKVLAAKQLEAFQAMSAFIVHDLKNTSSTLSLTLQNLPRHFENPEFREDALDAMSKSVNRINELIGRLTVLRKGLVIERTLTDLNGIAEAAVAVLDPDRRSRVTLELGELEPLMCDGPHIKDVVTNLLLNALDAGGDSGHVWLTTLKEDHRVRLSVRDDGEGMAPEFIEQSLFRPFQSTKQNGMGIGLFHSKTIVEAHGGRIEVQSHKGEGSTFSMVLSAEKEDA